MVKIGYICDHHIVTVFVIQKLTVTNSFKKRRLKPESHMVTIVTVTMRYLGLLNVPIILKWNLHPEMELPIYKNIMRFLLAE
jgi:hypothetical protein